MVAYVQVEGIHHICVVKGGTVYHSAGQEHGIHIGNRSDHAGTANLERYLAQDGAGLLCLELVCNSPSWRFGRHSQCSLLGKAIDLYDNAVRSHGKFLAVHIPVVDVLPEFLQAVAQLHVPAHLKTP